MKWFNNLNYIVKFIICIILLFICLYLVRLSFYNEIIKTKNSDYIEFTKTNIYDENDNYIIDVYYPKYKDIDLNKIVTDWLYKYIKDFKENSKENKETLEINYTLYNLNGFSNIFFEINNSLNKKEKRKSILIDLSSKKISSITELYNVEVLKDKFERVDKKYSSDISNIILSSDPDIFNYYITDDEFIVYFDNIEYSGLSYEPLLDFYESKESAYEDIKDKKMVSLTFDDGPNGNTLEILECLLLNNSKATFFELGNKMKANKDITKKLYDSGMEIGSHTYSHKYLTRIERSEILNEINSVSILFNEITNDNIKLLRAPYGSVNSEVRNLSPFPIISWDIDTKDWLYKEPKKSFDIIMSNVSDGDIILMHDIHKETIELVKMVVPELKARGFELVTVSEMAKYKNVKLENGVVYRKIK